MKKLALSFAIILGMTIGVSAQNTGGLFHRGATPDYDNAGSEINQPALPGHGQSTNQDAAAPLGSGAMLLIGFGAAYALSKKKK